MPDIVRAAPPTRAASNITLSLGFVDVPVRLMKGTQDAPTGRKQFVQVGDDYHPVGNKHYDKVTDEDVWSDDIVKLFEVDEGTAVELSDEEVAALIQAEPHTAEIVQFLPLSILMSGHYIIQSFYQIKPDVIGSGRSKTEVAGKAFDLLMTAMRKRELFAIAKVATKIDRPVRYAAILPNERLYMLHFDSEVRRDLVRTPNVPDQSQLKMLLGLVDAMTSREPIPLVDEYTQRLIDYARDKAAGKAVELPSSDPTTTVDDLAKQLEASIAQSKAS